jgi:hypothetical protein
MESTNTTDNNNNNNNNNTATADTATTGAVTPNNISVEDIQQMLESLDTDVRCVEINGQVFHNFEDVVTAVKAENIVNANKVYLNGVPYITADEFFRLLLNGCIIKSKLGDYLLHLIDEIHGRHGVVLSRTGQ